MAIFTALAFALILTVGAGIAEIIIHLYYKAKEKAEWRHLHSYYYPDGHAIRRLSEAEAIPADGWAYYPKEGE